MTEPTNDDPAGADDAEEPDERSADPVTAALVGCVGGAGTTRTTVELAATLARDGREVAVVDAAYATQGLADYLPGRIDPDCTALVTERGDDPLDAGLVGLPLPDDAPGRVACLPSRAPFERLARAKTETAARALGGRIDEAADRFGVVLVDVPPVAANQAVAAVTTVDRVVAVTPGTERGADALQRTRDRLADLGVEPTAAVATAAAPGAVESEPIEVDAVVPESVATPSAAPAAVDDDAFAAATADVAAALGLDVDLALDEESLVDDVGERVGTMLGR